MRYPHTKSLFEFSLFDCNVIKFKNNWFGQSRIPKKILFSDDKKEWEEKFKGFFSNGDEVFQGYVDDPRNTDNAWMETCAYNFHDDKGDVVGALKLNAGDDAVGVQWVDAAHDIKLYASHEDIVKEVLKRRLQAIAS